MPTRTPRSPDAIALLKEDHKKVRALLASLGGLLISAAVWALSSHSGNYHHASLGRRGTLISAVAAFLVGAAPAIVNFFENLGRTVH